MKNSVTLKGATYAFKKQGSVSLPSTSTIRGPIPLATYDKLSVLNSQKAKINGKEAWFPVHERHQKEV